MNNFFQNAHNKLISTGHALGEMVIPTLKETAFEEKGVLTPEEFVAAGDKLVRTCPSWKWEAGDPSKSKDFLPPNKQFLATYNVPCLERANAIMNVNITEDNTVEEDWISTNIADKDNNAAVVGGEVNEFEDFKRNLRPKIQSEENVETIPSANISSNDKVNNKDDGAIRNVSASYSNSDAQPNMDKKLEQDFNEFVNINDFDYVDDNILTPTQQSDLKESETSNLMSPRRYNLTICYDKYYQTPRLFLKGSEVTSSGIKILSVEEMFEDVIRDYSNKTVTLEKHPNLKTSENGMFLSVHPCRHAKVMKKLNERMNIKVEMYLFVFLKFLQSVIPTIEYDFTIPVERKH